MQEQGILQHVAAARLILPRQQHQVSIDEHGHLGVEAPKGTA